MKWYPLTFNPIYKEKIWGGTKLNTLKKVNPAIPNLGESWELSDVGDDVSIVSNGALTGQSLKSLLNEHGKEIMGTRVFERFGTQFPILIKYIDAAQDLSIQLHPDDKVALEKHHSFGKTEMWYIMDADKGAGLTLGFQETSDKSAFAKAISSNNLPALLNNQKVTAGESFFIKPGFVHAIGAGVTLAEIQQSSDVTYRVYDYDRRDDAGNPRDLHIEESIAVADYDKATGYKLNYDETEKGRQELIKTSYFETDILQFNEEALIGLSTTESFTILMNVGDACSLHHEGDIYEFENAQTYLIPAQIKNLKAQCDGNGKLLVVQL